MFEGTKIKVRNKAIDKMNNSCNELAKSLEWYQVHLEHGNTEMIKIELGKIAKASAELSNGAKLLQLML